MELPSLSNQLEEAGFAIVPSCLQQNTIEKLRERFGGNAASDRNLLSDPEIRELAQSKAVRDIAEAVLGPKCFAVRGIFFNKTPTSNWKVVWHQDLTIAVRERRAVCGFGPWTLKAGMPHVQPTSDVLSCMLAIRLHLDASKLDNGPLRVLSGSHRHGRLSLEQVRSLDKERADECIVPVGGALLMRPLLVHASSASSTSKPRRVLHLEFAASELPHGLDWHDRV